MRDGDYHKYYKLPRKGHQGRVQNDRQQHVAAGDSRHGQDSDEVFNLPVRRDERARGENNHAGDTDEGEGHAELELLEHFRDFDEEVGEFGFFGRGAPGHVDFEHVR